MTADKPTCAGCGGSLSRRRAAKGLTRCRPCAREANRANAQRRRDHLRYLRGPYSPLSPEARRDLPRR